MTSSRTICHVRSTCDGIATLGTQAPWPRNPKSGRLIDGKISTGLRKSAGDREARTWVSAGSGSLASPDRGASFAFRDDLEGRLGSRRSIRR